MGLNRRQLYARRVLVAQEAFVAKLRRQVQAELTRFGRALEGAYLDGASLDDLVPFHVEQLSASFRGIAPAIIKTFVRFGTMPTKSADLFETQLEWDVYYAMLGPLAEDAYRAATYSLELAKEAIASGLEDELTQKQIAARIYQRVGGVPSRSRAVTIARTEVHMAANVSQYQAAASAGVDMEKEWISTNDGRVRDSHRHVDGKRIALTAKFQVNGDLMGYPGDRSGSAKNVINCRCVIGYIVAGEE